MGGLVGGGTGASGVGASVGQLGTGIGQLIYGPAAAKDEENGYTKYLQQANQLLGTDQSNFNPYLQAGQAASTQFSSELPQLSQGFNPTQSQLESSPGYQFQLTQGENAVNNNMAAQGLSGSGAELQGLDTFSQGLANSAYQSLADVYNQNRNTTAGILNNGMQVGSNAAGELGGITNNLMSQIGQANVGYGQAQAGGAMARAQGVSDIANSAGSAISAI